MQVVKITLPDNTIRKIEFRREDEADFKAEIKTWISQNYPGMNWQEFFDRLEEFQNHVCRINMQ